MQQTRDDLAAKDYGFVRGMAKGNYGTKPQLNDMQDYTGTLQRLMDEYGAAPRGSDEFKLAGQIGQMLDAAPTMRDIGNLLKMRRFLSRVSGGQTKLSSDAAIPQQKRIAAQLLQAIDSDLSRNADEIGGDIGAALKKANERYRGYSQQIDAIQQSPLSKMLGEDVTSQYGNFNTIPGEVVLDKLRSLRPSQIPMAKKLIQEQAPDTWQAVKRSVIEDALHKSEIMAPSQGANTVVAQPNVFLKTLLGKGEDQAKLQAMFEPGEMRQLQDAFDAARRISDKTGYNFSGTAAANETLGVLNSLRHGLTAAGASLSTGFGLRGVARIMNDEGGRRALIQLPKLPPQAAKARELAAYLAAIAGSERGGAPGEAQQPANAGQ